MQYTNPILYGDYSDPDVIRVGEDFYMISSSFTYVPGIPVLHSRDLVHWQLIGYAAQHLPFARYDRPQHKAGTWAPSLRWHNGLFYVYVCLPDEGLFAFTASDPAGTWETHFVKDVCGWIDPCPLFASDGTAWLVHGFAASRCGINNILYVHQLSSDGMQVLDKGHLVYNGETHGDTTVEGPKFYERNGEYWILCPAGGVATGYQLALRSQSPLGFYERQVVLHQGETAVNGPHQGGWVEDGHGGDWFIHFQDVGVYGRVPHLQPVDWRNGWPVMGDQGEPVSAGDTQLAPWPCAVPTSDAFMNGLGLQWQWQANPNPAWYTLLHPGLRLHAVPAENLFHAGQFLSQLMQARCFTFTTRLSMHPHAGDEAGLAMMGYTYYALTFRAGELRLIQGTAHEVNRWTPERVEEETLCRLPWPGNAACLRLTVKDGVVSFACSADHVGWQSLGTPMPMHCGGWVSARPGIFCLNRSGWGGWADFDRVDVEIG